MREQEARGRIKKNYLFPLCLFPMPNASCPII